MSLLKHDSLELNAEEQRIKGSGMRWGEDGSAAVCHLRAVDLSERRQWAASIRIVS